MGFFTSLALPGHTLRSIEGGEEGREDVRGVGQRQIMSSRDRIVRDYGFAQVPESRPGG